MKIIKRGLLVFTFVLLLSNLVYASDSISLNLTTVKIGPRVPFDGFVDFEFSGYKSTDTPMGFFVGSVKTDVVLKKLLNLSGVVGSVLAAKYNTTSSGSENITIKFTSGGSKVESGIDLRGQSPRDINQFNLIGEYLSFNITPKNNNPKDLVILLADQILYKYRGSPSSWNALNKDYLVGTPDGTADISGGDFFCQFIDVKDSNEYNIKALVKRNSATPNNININVTMLDEMSDLVNPQSCSDPRTPCCTLYPSNDFSETKCIINKIINQPTKQYVCLYPTAEDPSVTYFYIKTDNDKPSSAYANGEALGDANFYVYDDYRTYDTALTQKTSINVPVQYIYDYIHKEGCDNECLLIPLNISVSSTGSLELSDLSLKYSYQIRREEKSFKSLIFIPESVKYDGKIRVDLNKLDDVISPSSLGKSTIYAKFNGLESKKINFEVVRSPSAFIRYGPFNPGINEEVNFDASTSKAESGKKLVSYIWDFGDDNIGNGTNTKHIYLQSGNYTVTLKVTDSDGVYGIDRVIINVQNGGNMNINSIVNNTLTSINLFKSKLDSSSAQIKDTANLLKINALLSNLESNLTAIKQSYNSLLADSNVSDAQISETINSLIKQAIAINNQIPSKFTADSASFSGKVTGLNQITSCCEFTTDIQKTKMLAAQQSVRVEGEVRIINIVYNSGRIENFMIIKKDIVGTGSKVYEFVPFGFSINPENVLVGGVVSAPAPNVYSFSPTNQIVYKIDTADLGKALQTRTAVLPGNLESITVNASQKESEVKPEPSVCGNKICESDEDEIGCAKDCKEKSRLPFVIIGVIVILAVLVAYFGYFFKGGLLRKKKFMPLDSKKLFKNEKDHNLVKDFVNDSLNKGLSEDKIKVALKSKGWNDMQINSVINETKLSKHKQQFIEKGAHLKH